MESNGTKRDLENPNLSRNVPGPQEMKESEE